MTETETETPTMQRFINATHMMIEDLKGEWAGAQFWTAVKPFGGKQVQDFTGDDLIAVRRAIMAARQGVLKGDRPQQCSRVFLREIMNQDSAAEDIGAQMLSAATRFDAAFFYHGFTARNHGVTSYIWNANA